MDCIFCKIIAKQIPNYTVYADEHALAFLDIFPHAKGHTVVVPKRHAETVYEMTEGELSALILATQRTMQRIQEVLKPEGFNVGWNHGKIGGQAVAHMHMHILPRWTGDGGGSMHSILKNPGTMSVSDIAALF